MTKVDRTGAAVVEFALILPILLVLVFGGVELSRLAMLRHNANHAAYMATRKAIVPGADVAQVEQNAQDHLATIGIRNATVTVNPSVITEDTSVVSVEVSFPVSENSLVVPEFVSGTVVGKSAMMTERNKSKMTVGLPTPPPPPPPPTPPTPPAPIDPGDDGGGGGGSNDGGGGSNFVIPIEPAPAPIPPPPAPSPTPTQPNKPAPPPKKQHRL